ncbi:MAG: type II toxin-antitoxin system Phd/YefM family antitoxin [Spirochaetia bacterium]
MIIKNIYQAKTHFSELIKKSLEGEEVIIAKSGKPVVRIIPYEEKPKPIKPGRLQDQIKIADDFNQFTPKLKEIFKGYIQE